MKKSVLILLALAFISTSAFAQSNAQVTIPGIVLQCKANELPCSQGGGQYSSQNDPFYILGLFITTASSCTASSMSSTSGTTVGFSGGVLTEDPNVFQNGTYAIYNYKFLDAKGALITTLPDQPYTICAFYGSVSQKEGTMTFNYYKEIHTSFKNIQDIAVDASDWIAL